MNEINLKVNLLVSIKLSKKKGKTVEDIKTKFEMEQQYPAPSMGLSLAHSYLKISGCVFSCQKVFCQKFKKRLDFCLHDRV